MTWRFRPTHFAFLHFCLGGIRDAMCSGWWPIQSTVTYLIWWFPFFFQPCCCSVLQLEYKNALVRNTYSRILAILPPYSIHSKVLTQSLASTIRLPVVRRRIRREPALALRCRLKNSIPREKQVRSSHSLEMRRNMGMMVVVVARLLHWLIWLIWLILGDFTEMDFGEKFFMAWFGTVWHGTCSTYSHLQRPLPSDKTRQAAAHGNTSTVGVLLRSSYADSTDSDQGPTATLHNWISYGPVYCFNWLDPWYFWTGVRDWLHGWGWCVDDHGRDHFVEDRICKRRVWS